MTALTFDVPYFYSASYVPPGKRKAIDGTFAGLMEVEIESLNSMEAPVVATVTRDDGISRVTREFVGYQGRFYTSQSGSWWNDNAPDIEIAQFDASHLDLHPERALAHFIEGKYAETPDGPVLCVEGGYNEEYFEAAIEERRQEVRDAAARVIFVDGVLMKECPLPTIKARIDYRMGGKDSIRVDLGKADDELGSHGAIFTLDQLASAEAWAKDREAREHGAEYASFLNVEIHEPSLIPANSVFADEAIRVVRFIMNRDVDLKEQTDEYLLKYIVARRAVVAAMAEKTDENLSVMLESFSELYTQYGADETVRRSRYSSTFNLEDDLDYKALAGIVAAWENRPIHGEGPDVVWTSKAALR